MQIAFRVDASRAIGAGHVMRCLSLADTLAEDGDSCRFVMRAHPLAPLELIEQHGHSLVVLPAPTSAEATDELAHSAWLGASQQLDADQTIAALQEPVDWLVVDHYGIDHRWESKLRPSAKAIAAIDDIADRIHDCDLLLDQNLQVASHRYDQLVPAHCRQLIGPRFALLRGEFAEWRSRNVMRSRDAQLRSIVVYFGGADPGGATVLALSAIDGARLSDVNFEIVVGAANPDSKAIEDWCSRRTNATFHGGGTDIARLLAGSDLALGAAGISAWERCCLGVPTLLLTLAANQRPGAEALAREGAALWVGDAANMHSDDLAAALRTVSLSPHLLRLIGSRAQALVDGRGAARVASAMRARPITLRPATSSDCDTLWEWRNDERTRRFSKNSQKVALQDHRRWFAAVLGASDRHLLIGECAGEPVGVLRFDCIGSMAEVSIYLVPGRGGRGEGSRLLEEGVRWLAQTDNAVATLEAEILIANVASQQAFEAVGFRPYLNRMRFEVGGVAE